MSSLLPTPKELTDNDKNEVIESIRNLMKTAEEIQRRISVSSTMASAAAIRIIAGEGDPFNPDEDPFTGTALLYPPYIDPNGDEWHFIAMNAGVLQAGVSALDGKYYFGAGAGYLDADGISILETPSGSYLPANSIKFYESTGTTIRTNIYQLLDDLYLRVAEVAGKNSILRLWGEAPTGKIAGVQMLAQQNGGAIIAQISVSVSAAGLPEIELNGASADVDTSIYGTSATPVIKVDAGLNRAEITVGAAGGNVYAGTYTPTLTNVTNIASSTASACQYMRVGNVVTVSGVVGIDPTATGVISLRVSLPIASNFSSGIQCGGVASAIAIAETYGIYADAANDDARIEGVATSAANANIFFSFTYQIL